jgi:hypothetical protein
LGDSVAAAGSEADGNNLGLEFIYNFPYNQNSTNQPKRKHMKKLLTLTSIVSAGAVLALISACQTTGAGGGEVSRKEAVLSQSGFKVITVTTPAQQQAVSGLAMGRCSAVKYNGKLYYVFPTATKDRVYVGKQAQYNRYRKAIAAQQASQPSQAGGQQGQQLIQGQSLYPTMETAGIHSVEVQQFGGFGPMGTAALGDW